MKLSGKDLLILLGVLVAAVITLTTLFYQDEAKGKADIPLRGKTSVNQVTTKVVGALIRRMESEKIK